MTKYGDVLARISEIIKFSEQKKLELDTDEYSFQKILWYDIDSNYEEEFNNLLETEKLFHIINSNKKSIKNSELMKICKDGYEKNSEGKDLYLELYRILRNSLGKHIDALVIFKDYIVLREDLEDFKKICHDLQVGAYKLLKDMSPEEVTREFNKQNQLEKEQFYRISKYLNAHNLKIKGKTPDSSVKKNIFNSKFKDLIYLGIVGELNIQMVSKLENLFSKEEYLELITELEVWKIFKQEEINYLKESINSSKEESLDLDNLIGLLISRGNFDPEGLRELIPFIGYEAYQYMINKLHLFGLIEDPYLNEKKNR